MYSNYYEKLNTAQFQAHYRISETDSGASNETLVLNITSPRGTRLIITHIGVSPQNISNPIGVNIYYRDSGNNLMGIVGFDTSLNSGSVLSYPSTGTAMSADNNKMAGTELTLFNGDTLQIYNTGLEQNERVQVWVRGYIKGKIPSVNSSGSSGSPDIDIQSVYII